MVFNIGIIVIFLVFLYAVRCIKKFRTEIYNHFESEHRIIGWCKQLEPDKRRRGQSVERIRFGMMNRRELRKAFPIGIKELDRLYNKASMAEFFVKTTFQIFVILWVIDIVQALFQWKK
ncbi:hypothetical protein SMSP2_02501 [Limihaloglobus sulfuriphilus]|uniref:Uncharacterized protein n=1 Tax=Limihaloglobus sulfuriphilus TaxID=1851148 RepID=A0A1Q2MHF3_9BACT|nr:hypothetical protein SMSP2_02501 [Limihaloglobus sulfuriphilus]